MVSAERLLELLDYDPQTGIFIWKYRLGKGARNDHVGKIAGRIHIEGYRLITIGQHSYKAHRLAWLYVHGRWPIEQIDHISGKPDDNRLENLREVCQWQNNVNGGPYRSNKSGIRGVSFVQKTKKWKATIAAANKRHHLGFYDNIEDAAAVRRNAEKHLHGEFARGQW